MLVEPIQTDIISRTDSLVDVLLRAQPTIPERSILVVTSKVVALTQGALYPERSLEQKHQLARELSQQYIDPDPTAQHPFLITITHGVLALSAGIDGSNTESGELIALPQNPLESATKLLEELRVAYSVSELGVIITDSTTRPLRWGVVGTYLGYSGFRGVYDQRGERDLFGRRLAVTTTNFAESAASIAVATMGEAAQSQPFCLLTQLPEHIEFCQTYFDDDLGLQQVSPSEDVYAALLTKGQWRRGGNAR